MRTLFDEAVILGVKYHTLMVWEFSAICTLGSLKNDWPEWIACVLSLLYILSFEASLFVLLWIPMIRLASIKWSIALDQFPDKTWIRCIHLTSWTMAFICTFLEFAFISDIKTSIWFNGLTGQGIENAKVPKGTLGTSALVGISYVLLQFYIEHRFSEKQLCLGCLLSGKEDTVGNNVHFYRSFFAAMLFMAGMLFFQPIKNSNMTDEFVPQRALIQYLVLNFLMFCALWSKGKKMKNHVVSFFV